MDVYRLTAITTEHGIITFLYLVVYDRTPLTGASQMPEKPVRKS